MRHITDRATGLTANQVHERIGKGRNNSNATIPSKSIPEIIYSNVFTLFNFLNFGLALAILLVGSFKNMTFMGVVFFNTLIGVIQEINAKRIIDKLSLMSAVRAKVIRNGKISEIPTDQVVIDDLLVVGFGDQVVCDSVIIEGGCEVDESLITGESEPVYKHEGDHLLSGSFLVAGEIKAQVIHVGDENYSAGITKEAKALKNKKSLLMDSLNKIIKSISFVIVPLGTILFIKQLSIDGNGLYRAVVNTVAALIGMIPEGLILLTSSVLAVSIIRLAKYRVLIQQLYSVETLARVDTICLDKTGTLTDGQVEFVEFIDIEKTDNIDRIMSELLANLNEDTVVLALKEKYHRDVSWTIKQTIPFSSLRKWSGASFESMGTFVMGAPEFVMAEGYKDIEDLVEKNSIHHRVLVLARSDYEFNGQDLPRDLKPLGLILLRDNIREEAAETLKFFREQGVGIKIISGDNALTVSSIAKRLGMDVDNNYIDASSIKDSEGLVEASQKYHIFGRTSPEQKKKIIEALQAKGHTVGFVGDGVNDVLALKTADCGIAMASGSDAARNVSELVLLDSNFDSMPFVVNEGRRTINNIQRSASLYLVKTIYAAVLAILFLFINRPYPFEPVQFTLTGVFTIGIPSFILAIEPNRDRIKGNFLTNVIGRAMPAALANVINVILVMVAGKFLHLSHYETSTLAVILTAFVGFVLLFRVSRPFNAVRLGLLIFCLAGFLASCLGLPFLFSLSDMHLTLWLVMASLMAVSIVNIKYLTMLFYFLIPV